MTAVRTPAQRALPDRLNRECFCITLDPAALCQAMVREVGDPQFCAAHLKSRPHLFSPTPAFLARDDVDAMLAVVQLIEAASRLPGYREAVLAWAPAIARPEFGPRGAFMGYDFHLTADGPKLIEVNTNAGGAFLNALLAKAHRACCVEIEPAMSRSTADGFDAAVLEMFRREWALQRGARPLRTIAIVDDAPAEQFLYPEFLLAQRFLQKSGFDAIVADAAELRSEGGQLRCGGKPIDLVYNRLVDFALEQDRHRALSQAYTAGAVVVTPNPHVHALLADKRNLTLLSDREALRNWGLPIELLDAVRGIPAATLLSQDNAPALWARRKNLFFKPACGYGSKAVYRGDKLTSAVWNQIVNGGYIAQDLARASERWISIDGVAQMRKMDVRLYVYAGQPLLAAARIYQGQATNFRTPGGGFAPVFLI